MNARTGTEFTPSTTEAGAYAVYDWADTGECWGLVDAFTTLDDANQHAARLVAERDQENPAGVPNIFDDRHRSETIVVAVASRSEAEASLPVDHIVPVVARYVHGAPPPGPQLFLSDEEEERLPPDRQAGVP